MQRSSRWVLERSFSATWNALNPGSVYIVEKRHCFGKPTQVVGSEGVADQSITENRRGMEK